MPRVLRIINRLNLGGPTYNAAYLTKYLSPEFETILLSGVKQESEESSEFIIEQLGLKAVYLNSMHRDINLSRDWQVYNEIKKVIRDFKPDIVHTHAAKAGTLGRLAAHHCNVKIILHTFHGHVFHSYFSPLKTRFFIRIERYLAGISSRIIAISNKQKHEICNEFGICPTEKCEVIPLGFDLSRFRENIPNKRKVFRAAFGIADDEIAIGIIGRLTAIKNHSLFVKAFSHLRRNTREKVKAVIIGGGEDDNQIKNLCSNLALNYSIPENINSSSPVIFTSWIKDIDRAMAGLDIVCMTSLNEGTPVSLIEAQAAGRPVVSTRVGGVEDLIVENETGLLSNSGDVEHFAVQLRKLVNNKELRQQLSEKAGSLVFSRYHVDRLVNDTRQLYQKLIAEKG
ncbi:MAG: glycosyltransferase [Bacteroidia bacterium]|nr:glycosyltransferase [Bacteroidia bacterium]MCZ2277467.1 glycosyltransferase [Bacteroidia bacterium]